MQTHNLLWESSSRQRFHSRSYNHIILYCTVSSRALWLLSVIGCSSWQHQNNIVWEKTKREFRALRWLVEESGAQISLTRNNIDGIGKSIRSMCDSEAGVGRKNWGFLTMGWLVQHWSTDSMWLSQRRKRGSAELIDRAWKGEGENTRLASDEQQDVVPNLEEMSTNGIGQSAAQGAVYKVPHTLMHTAWTNKMNSKLWPSPRDSISLT